MAVILRCLALCVKEKYYLFVNPEALAELQNSSSFLSWTPGPKPPKQPTVSLGRGRSFTYEGKRYTNLIVDEKHYSPADLAKAWGVNVETIRNVFREEPGVVKIGAKVPSHKRSYLTLRIPQSVAERVHRRLSA